jgi:hypothetical protein
MSQINKTPNGRFSNILFYSLLAVVCGCIVLLAFFRELSFVEDNLPIIAMLTILLGVPVFGTLIMVFGEKIGGSKERND